jgi:ribosome-binding ATPase YchF (GTP1/OBG family)
MKTGMIGLPQVGKSSEVVTRSRGTLWLKGTDYLVKDGDTLNIRHSS